MQTLLGIYGTEIISKEKKSVSNHTLKLAFKKQL